MQLLIYFDYFKEGDTINPNEIRLTDFIDDIRLINIFNENAVDEKMDNKFNNVLKKKRELHE